MDPAKAVDEAWKQIDSVTHNFRRANELAARIVDADSEIVLMGKQMQSLIEHLTEMDQAIRSALTSVNEAVDALNKIAVS